MAWSASARDPAQRERHYSSKRACLSCVCVPSRVTFSLFFTAPRFVFLFFFPPTPSPLFFCFAPTRRESCEENFPIPFFPSLHFPTLSLMTADDVFFLLSLLPRFHHNPCHAHTQHVDTCRTHRELPSNAVHQYFLKVVPTSFLKLKGEALSTHQYSVTESSSKSEGFLNGNSRPSGVYFHYELSAIRVSLLRTVTRERARREKKKSVRAMAFFYFYY